MNKILELTGGFRRKLDDILLLQENLLDFIENVMTPLIGDNPGVILSGIEPTVAGLDLSWSDGYIFHAGEIYFVGADHMAYNPAKYYYFNVDSDTDRPRQKKNGVTEDHWEVRTAIVVESPSLNPSETNILTAHTWKEAIEGKWITIPSGDFLSNIEVENAPTPILSGSSLDDENVIHYKVHQGFLEMIVKGYIIMDGSPSDTTEYIKLLLPNAINTDIPFSEVGYIRSLSTPNQIMTAHRDGSDPDGKVILLFNTTYNSDEAVRFSIHIKMKV